MNHLATGIDIISSQKEFEELCSLINIHKIVAIDTEFERNKTYYPILCIIQINVNDDCFIVDCLHENIDLKPIKFILENPNIIKIFHSYRQDIEIFLNYFEEINIKSTYDTQIMSNICGYKYNISYAALIKKLLNKKINKELRRSDWKQRPLCNNQVEYAKQDVKYLIKAYQILQKEIKNQNKSSWLNEETILSNNSIILLKDNINIYKKFSFKNKSTKHINIIKRLVDKREEMAIEKNKPRGFIIKDDAIILCAKHKPTTIESLNKIIGNNYSFSEIKDIIIKIINEGFELESDNIQQENITVRDIPTENQKKLFKEAQELLVEIALVNHINPEFIITQHNLKKIIFSKIDCSKFLQGWRAEIFSKKLEELLA